MVIQGKQSQNISVEIDIHEQRRITNQYLRQKFDLPPFCDINDLYVDQCGDLILVESLWDSRYEVTKVLRVATEKDKLVLQILKEINY